MGRTTAASLSIRPTEASDLGDLRRLWNDGRVMCWVGFPDGLGIDDGGSRDWFEWIAGSPDRHHYVVHEGDGRFCGELYYRLDAAGRAELDIKLRPEAQGRGIGSEAFGWLLETVFEREPAAVLAWTEPRPENVRSRALYARWGLRPEPRPPDLEGSGEIWVIRREGVRSARHLSVESPAGER
jgi:RimJ/RimL family protein N-acetyltransferase